MRTIKKAIVLLCFVPLFMPALSNAQDATAGEIRNHVRQFGLPVYLDAMVSHEVKGTPKMINGVTEMVSVQHRHYKDLHQIIILLRIVDTDVRGADPELIAEARRASLRADGNFHCTSPIYGTLINEYSVEYKYTYHDKDMRFIHSFDVNKRLCQELAG